MQSDFRMREIFPVYILLQSTNYKICSGNLGVSGSQLFSTWRILLMPKDLLIANVNGLANRMSYIVQGGRMDISNNLVYVILGVD